MVLIFELKEGTLLAKLAFLALKRCVMNIFSNLSLHAELLVAQYLLRTWIHLEHACYFDHCAVKGCNTSII
jgi:hypothetical protein